MKDEVVTFDTAKLAKEKGFKEECDLYWANYYVGEPRNKLKLIKRSLCKTTISFMEWEAPTQSLLQKWLREVHNINITVDVGIRGFYGNYKKTEHPNIQSYIQSWTNFEDDPKKTYEQALEKALFVSLTLIDV